MTDSESLYVEAAPGGLITAEAWNEMQRRIRHDIADTTQRAVEEVTEVDRAKDAEKLEGSSAAELTDEIVRRAVQEVRALSGYRQLFKILKLNEEKVIEHKLTVMPLVDLYALDYFPVVCSEDGQIYPMWATFYLYHDSEGTIRYTGADNKPASLPVQPRGGHPYRIPFAELLARYRVDYSDDSSLGDVDTEFWNAFFADPNDRFDDNQYCHSPWFDRCCREEKSVRDLKKQRDWDNLYLQMRPRRVAIPTVPLGATANERRPAPQPAPRPQQEGEDAPTLVEVVHFDFDTAGLRLLNRPAYPAELFNPEAPAGSIEVQVPGVRDELKVMVLLKC